MKLTILPQFIQDAFSAKMEELYVRAEGIFVGWGFPRPTLAFDLHGKILGCYERRFQKHNIRLHEEFCMYEYHNMLNDTLAHEIAHHLVYEVFEASGPDFNPKPLRQSHGVEWQSIATMLGAKAEAKCKEGYEMTRCNKTGKVRPAAALKAEIILQTGEKNA